MACPVQKHGRWPVGGVAKVREPVLRQLGNVVAMLEKQGHEQAPGVAVVFGHAPTGAGYGGSGFGTDLVDHEPESVEFFCPLVGLFAAYRVIVVTGDLLVFVYGFDPLVEDFAPVRVFGIDLGPREEQWQRVFVAQFFTAEDVAGDNGSDDE